MRISDCMSDVCSSDLAAISEAKISGRVLIVMPLVAMAVLVAMNPDYIDFFLRDPRGHRLAAIALVLQGMGMLVMRRVMRLARSEEHTSELQSLLRISYAVFCLKKKKRDNTDTNT